MNIRGRIKRILREDFGIGPDGFDDSQFRFDNIELTQEEFEQHLTELVKRYKPQSRQSSTYGTELEFPIQAKDELEFIGAFPEVFRVTNHDHPNYGKRFVVVNVFDPSGKFRKAL